MASEDEFEAHALLIAKVEELSHRIEQSDVPIQARLLSTLIVILGELRQQTARQEEITEQLSKIIALLGDTKASLHLIERGAWLASRTR